MLTDETDPLTVVRAALFGATASVGREGGVTPLRLPEWTQLQDGADPMFRSTVSANSGVRLEFDTSASWIELVLRFTRTSFFFVPFPPRPSIVTLEADGTVQHFSIEEGDVNHIDQDLGTTLETGGVSTLRCALAAATAPRRVVIWLPHGSAVEILSIDSDAELVAAPRSRTRWLHYGSSISHCLEAESPLGVWPVVAARELDLDLYNLGLAGSALLDGFVARTIRDTPADLITLKVGINIVNTGGFRVRTFIPAVHAFLDTVREGHPDTPIVLISPIICPAHEDAPGPTEWSEHGQALGTSVPRRPLDGQLTLGDIRAILETVVRDRSPHDSALRYLDGRELFGPDDLAHLPDGLHPDPAGYTLMGERMAQYLRASR